MTLAEEIIEAMDSAIEQGYQRFDDTGQRLGSQGSHTLDVLRELGFEVVPR